MNYISTDIHWITIPLIVIGLTLLLFKQTKLGQQAFNMFKQWLLK